jgi:hypothetical protein
MSGTDYTTTPNLGLYKPIYDQDAEAWGTHLNANADVLDGALATSGASAKFLPLSGGTMLGGLTLAADPSTALGAVTKQYADAHQFTDAANDANTYGRHANAWSAVVPLSGAAMTGPLTLSGAPSATLHAANKGYVDTFLPLAGGTVSGSLLLPWTPTVVNHATNKGYVDNAVVGAANNVGRNRLHNGGFRINQRGYTSGTALAAAAYAHDRWKAGAGGCTYTFTQVFPTTTITIAAGSLQQTIESADVEGGSYTLSWVGTAQGRVNAGSYAASPITVTGIGANGGITVEFNAGTVGMAQLEAGSVATVFERIAFGDDLRRCQRFYCVGRVYSTFNAASAGGNSVTTAFLPVAMRAVPNVTVALGGGQANFNTPTTTSLGQAQSFGVGGTTPATGVGFLDITYTAFADL